MKILVISNLYPPFGIGGYEARCLNIVDRLRDMGHDMHVLTSDYNIEKGGAGEESQIYRKLLIHGFYGRPWLPIHKLYSLEKANNAILQSTIDSVCPDVIHVWNMGGISKSLLHRLESGSIPVVYDISDHWIARSLKADVWLQWWNRRASGGASMIRKLLEVFGFRKFLSQAAPTDSVESIRWKHIYFCSAFMRDATVEAGYRVDHASVIPCGVEVERFAQKKSYGSVKRFVWVGRIAEDKDPYTAVRGFAQTFLEHPDISLTIYGRGEDGAAQKLKDLIDELGLDGVVTLASASHEEMLSVYAQYDALLFSSNWGEPFALTPLESMAAGLPVVSTLDGGQRELARDGENMWVFDAANPDSLCIAMKKLIQSEDAGKAMAELGRREVSELYDMPIIAKRIESFLKDAVSHS